MSTPAPVLRVGCPMWAHPPWVGRFLSPAARGRELAEYAGWCNAVEGNTTFYAVPSPPTVARWADQSPADFRFAFKLPRTITHERRLRGTDAELSGFLSAIEPLGDRIGPVQIQLPPTFGPESIPTLGAFVSRLPTGFRWVVELRHRALFEAGGPRRTIDAILRDAGVGRVVLDTRPLYAAPPRTDAAVDERRSKPRLPVLTDLLGEDPILRVIGADDHDVTLRGLLDWIPTVVDLLAQGRRPYVFVHQPENVDSPALARRLHAAVAERVPGLVPLPEPPPVTPAGEVPGQSALF